MKTLNRIQVLVEDVILESPVVKRFKLRSLNGSNLPKFSSGSHITTFIGNAQQPMERNYSLISSPDCSDSYEIAIRLSEQSNGGSKYWHTKIKTGESLEISHPKNHFAISYEAKHHVFIAAGIGITPFLTMAQELKELGKSFELHYTAPIKEFCAFYSLLREEFPNEVQFYFSREGERMTTEIMKKQKVGTHVYFCGPPSMIKSFSDAAVEIGYSKRSIHFELFSPPEQGKSHEFKVMLKKSGIELIIPKEKSLLDVLHEQEIDAPYSCKIGSCGSCQLEVIAGEVSHHDAFLSCEEKKQNKFILPCVSRAKGNQLILNI